jgi:phosphatidylglycerophosphate synthase
MKLFDKNLNLVVSKVLHPLMGLIPPFISPNIVSVLGLLVSFFGVVYALVGNFQTGMMIVVLGLVFDILDGNLARYRKMESKGGYYVDRIVDIFVCILLIFLVLLKFTISSGFLFVLFVLYLFRLYFVFTERETEIGGLRVQFSLGLLLITFIGKEYITFLLLYLVFINLLSSVISWLKIDKY